MLCIHNSKLVSHSPLLHAAASVGASVAVIEAGEGGENGLQQRVEMCSGDDG